MDRPEDHKLRRSGRCPHCNAKLESKILASTRNLLEQFERSPNMTVSFFFNGHKGDTKDNGVKNPTGELRPTWMFSNFAQIPVSVQNPHNGVVLPFASAEAAFQAGKYLSRQDIISDLQVAYKGGECRKIARRFKSSNVSGWIKHGLNVKWMRVVTYCKFLQCENLRSILMQTGERRLVEDSPFDSFWGIGKDRKGTNMLGVILMEIRAQFLQDACTNALGEVHPETSAVIQGSAVRKGFVAAYTDFKKTRVKCLTGELQ
ncbi:hypothetical protein KIPB_008604 [Kipferlia bialata]|uniref:NADAR domain-containing protein n=1 Tax=Kipferlia bialata TaxID=797122 RepID=A0A9K3D097_9EUKA|nr:hypothetical protein KIPB_008604 [Kipferlia bialata]|eukprot:g8604.t1